MSPSSGERGFDAVLWDLDGTIVDTEPCYIEVSRDIQRRGRGAWPADMPDRLHGMAVDVMARILQAEGCLLSAETIVNDLTSGVLASIAAFLPRRPGAVELLTALREEGVPTALVTMSPRRVVDQVLRQLPGNPFDVVVTADDVASPKPAPDAYLLAAKTLGLSPGRCIAIEDSFTGLTAAKTAGVIPLGVPSQSGGVPASYVELIWDSLQGRELSDLVHAVQTRQR